MSQFILKLKFRFFGIAKVKVIKRKNSFTWYKKNEIYDIKKHDQENVITNNPLWIDGLGIEWRGFINKNDIEFI